MNTATQELIKNNFITISGSQLVTTSKCVADAFNKRHDNVLRKIDSLDCSEEFNALNFEVVDHIDSKGEKRRIVQMTKDGFVFLVMGFTGKQAGEIKEAYITAFNMMAEQLSGKREPILLDGQYHASVRDGKITLTPTDDNAITMTIEQIPEVLRNRLIVNEQLLADITNVCIKKLAYKAGMTRQ